jgi:hypothetical protein
VRSFATATTERDSDAALLIPRSVGLDRALTLRVAEDVERQEQFVDHRLVLVRRVDADRRDLAAALLKLVVFPGIAHELPVAVRSPIASVEDQHLCRTLERVTELPELPVFVPCCEEGCSRTYVHLGSAPRVTSALGLILSLPVTALCGP